MSNDSVRDDISFMRSMAEQGGRGPILGGAFLAAAGLIYGAASLLQWAVMSGRLQIPLTIGQVWIAASVTFAAVWFLLFFRLRRSGAQSGNVTQVTFGTAWVACGIGILMVTGAIAITSWRLHDPAMLNAEVLVSFAFYGVAWAISGVMARQGWMFAAAAAAFAITLLLAYLTGVPDQMLVFGAGLVLTLTLPGVKLMTQAAR